MPHEQVLHPRLVPIRVGMIPVEGKASCLEKLVPIRVGMILRTVLPFHVASPCPHTRGDDPKIERRDIFALDLSPYAWG